MKRIENYETVQASSGEFARPTAGGYIVKIVNVEDVPFDEATGKGDYLKIEYDIAVGDLAGYYTEQFNKWGGFWSASFVRSYKEKALGMFKHFTNCIEESNSGYIWDWAETTLIGKLVGVVFGEEEYRAKSGEVKKRLYVKDIKTVQEIKDGKFNVPKLKELPDKVNTVTQTAPNFEELPTDDLPF